MYKNTGDYTVYRNLQIQSFSDNKPRKTTRVSIGKKGDYITRIINFARYLRNRSRYERCAIASGMFPWD